MTGLRAAWGTWAASLVLLIGSAITSVGRAQDAQQTALARTLFEEGVSLADRGDWVGAADRFERAHSLKPTPGIAYNWASALRETGKLLQAQELLMSVTRDAHADAELKHQAGQALNALSPRIARLKLHVAPAAAGDGETRHADGEPDRSTRVEVDGASWPRAAWDVWSPIDPGAHVVLLKRDEAELRRVELSLAEGEQRELVLSEHAAQSAGPLASGAGLAPGADAGEPTKTPLYKRWWLWGAVGAVVAGGVIAAAVVATHHGAQSASPVAGNAMPGVLRW